MSAIGSSLIVFMCVSAGAVGGIVLHNTLPRDHLSSESQDIVKLGMGLVATMSALVLGLLISSAKTAYDTQGNELTQMSAKVIFLDRILGHYGPETKEARDLLRASVVANLDRIWPQERGRISAAARPPSAAGPPSSAVDTLLDKVQALSAKDDRQRTLKAQALSVAFDLAENRWLLFEQGATSVPKSILLVLVFWLTAIFISFGLFAPRNATVTSALFVAGLAVSGAVFLILEMYTPFSGLVQLSSAPLRFAVASLGQ